MWTTCSAASLFPTLMGNHLLFVNECSVSFRVGIFLCSDIPLHDRCRIRNRSAQLDLLPLGADLLVDLCKLLVDVCFFFRESLP